MDTATTTLPKGQMTKSFEHEDSAETKTLSDQKDHLKVIAKGTIHSKPATTQDYLSDGIDHMNFRPVDGKYGETIGHGDRYYPSNGEMSVLIDDQGNWEFSVKFEPGPQQTVWDFDVAVGLGLKSSIGQVILFTAQGRVLTSGGGWLHSKQGHAPIIKDLWKDVAKGHKFHGQWATQALPSQPPSSGSSGGSSGSDLGSEIVEGITAVLGVIAAIF
jgi:hypothetical protein